MKKKAKKAEKFALDNYRHPDEFGNWLGYRVVKTDRRKFTAETALEIRKDHLSLAGRVHGGVVSAFLDYSCGAAAFTTLERSDYASTVELKVNYLKALFLGDRLRAETRVVFRGKRLCVIHGFLYRNSEKEPVAMATATFNVVTGRAPRPC